MYQKRYPMDKKEVVPHSSPERDSGFKNYKGKKSLPAPRLNPPKADKSHLRSGCRATPMK
jgi:hypothetical protein